MAGGKPGNPAWVKGKSGNPGGRPKIVEGLRQRALKAVDETVLDAWIDECRVRERHVMGALVECRGPDWVRCSQLLAEYGMGKPVQPVESKIDVEVRGAREMSREQLLAIAAGQESADTEH